MAQPASSDERVPIIRQVDHVMVHASDAPGLYALLTDSLQLAPAWPLATYPGFTSGGVAAGNANIEIIHFDPPPEPVATHAATWIQGIAFEPDSTPGSIEELARRGIPVEPSQSVTRPGPQGEAVPLWTTCPLVGFLSAPAEVFLVDYAPEVRQQLTSLRAAAQRRQSSGLGVQALQEIVVGVTDLPSALDRWQQLFDPVLPTYPGLWDIGGGPAIRLIPHTTEIIITMVLRVVSLERATHYLGERGLLGEAAGKHVTIAATALGGLDLRLVE